MTPMRTYPSNLLGLLFFLFLSAVSINCIFPDVSLCTNNNNKDKLDVVIATIPENWPPYYMMNEDGQPTGFAIESFDEIARLAKIKVIYKPEKTFAESVEALRSGKADLIPNSGITPDRFDEFDFSRPIETFEVFIFTRKATNDISSLADLANRKVGVIVANIGEKIVEKEKRITVVTYPHVSIALVDLLSGQIDAIIYPKPILLQIAQNAGVDSFIKTTGPPLLEVKRGIRFRKGDKFLTRLDPAVEIFQHSAAYKRIYIKWFGQPKPFWDIQKVLISFGSILTLCVVFFLTWRFKITRDMNQLLRENLSLKEQKEKALQITKDHLETEIDKKTHEILAGVNERRKMELVLLQQEKMASIGYLAAGVAHEINNPIAFISSNLGSLQKYVGNLIKYFDASKENLSHEALQLLRKELKIDFIFEDLEDLIKESQEGTKRVSSIVQSLKIFSRAESEKPEEADINQCLENTIKVVWNEIKYKAEIVKEYGDLPLVTCHPQQISQVFMNLLINACQSLEKGEIKITTWHDKSDVFVSISDNGHGISADKIKHIFDPFFTTKEVGKGTGLGLSISYEIIQRHKGSISVESTVGKGATFTVQIPRELDAQSSISENGSEV